jgi:hypothetical protein
MQKYLIEVNATHEFTRTYEIEAEDEHAALAAYQADAEEVVWVSDNQLSRYRNRLKENEALENGDSACVYTTDGNKTLLLDVSDAL